jgi:hypothetical protein
MELVTVLRLLQRRWLLVAAGGLVALFVGVLATGALRVGPFDGTQTRSGYAEARIVVDTPKPLVADLEASDATIDKQSVLLAEHLRDTVPLRALARRARVPAALLSVRTVQFEQFVPTQLGTRSTEVAAAPTPYTVTVNPSPTVPIISVVAVAPDRAAAARLAAAAQPVVESIAAANAPLPQRALSVKPLGPVRAITVLDGGTKPLLGAIAFVGLFAFWCGAIVVLTGVARVWHRLAGDPPPRASGAAIARR